MRRAALRSGWKRLFQALRRVPLAERRRATGRDLAAVLGELRGVYTKLGQHLALRADLLPDETREELARLAEGAPPVPFESVRLAIRQSLGPLGNRFSWIDPHPIGTASIAQVHRAHLSGHGLVAVKVRHAELTPARLEQDLRSLRRGVRRLRRRLGGLDSDRVVDELGRALRDELDFEREGRIGEQIARNLADDPHIVVPAVHWQASGPGVLTLDYVPRIRLDDRRALERAGLRPAECLEIVANAYGRQIFEHGLFHADPHLGNVFAVDESSPLRPPGEARPRILFVDFGLSQQLPDRLAEELRAGLHALLARDVEALLAGLQRIDAVLPGREVAARRALEQALEAGAGQALGASPGSIAALRELGKRLVLESAAFRLPAELVLYARTLAHVFALAEQIDPGSSPMPRLLPHVLRFLAGPGGGARVRASAASDEERSDG